MTSLFAERALINGEWVANARITCKDGLIAQVLAGAGPEAGDERHAVVIPGIPNLHSHAFQRAMAGLAERRGPTADSFWSWRELMYRFALSMTPDDVEAVAGQLYVEMLEAGFTRVGEFHYLHHDKDGRPYAAIAEMAQRIAAAATEAGIGLTLLPVFYAHAGFGGTAPGEGQRRFINDLDAYARLIEGARAAIAPLPGANLGIAPHSLRAVTPDELAALVPLAAEGPIHIHIAEQVKEVEDCLAWCGARPVEWLLANAPVDARWCLIHATHMTEAETRGMAGRGAVAGLCPITEANLGDGLFNAVPFRAAGGLMGVGSDSNVEIGAAAELRMLEYGQRLSHRARNVLAPAERSTGEALVEAVVAGGARALAVPEGIAPGHPADLVTLRPDPALPLPPAGLVDGWVFSGGNRLVDCVYVNGRKRVEGGRHAARAAVAGRFRATLGRLLA